MVKLRPAAKKIYRKIVENLISGEYSFDFVIELCAGLRDNELTNAYYHNKNDLSGKDIALSLRYDGPRMPKGKPMDLLDYGCKYDRLDFVQYLLDDRKVPVQRNNKYLLHEAIEHNRYNIVKYLLEHGSDPNYVIRRKRGSSKALHNVMKRSRKRCIEFIKNDNVDIYSLLCEHGLEYEMDITHAVRYEMIDITQYILDKDPILVNSVDSQGFSPLMLACNNFDKDMVNVLLEHGADIHYIRCTGNNRDVVGNLLSRLPNDAHYMIKCEEIMYALLNNGANPHKLIKDVEENNYNIRDIDNTWCSEMVKLAKDFIRSQIIDTLCILRFDPKSYMFNLPPEIINIIVDKAC